MAQGKINSVRCSRSRGGLAEGANVSIFRDDGPSGWKTCEVTELLLSLSPCNWTSQVFTIVNMFYVLIPVVAASFPGFLPVQQAKHVNLIYDEEKKKKKMEMERKKMI